MTVIKKEVVHPEYTACEKSRADLEARAPYGRCSSQTCLGVEGFRDTVTFRG